jgi:hypothetical protein
MQGWAGSGLALDLRLGPSDTAHQSGGGWWRVREVAWRAAPYTITAGREVGWSVLGADFRGSWSTELGMCPSGDRSRRCSAAQAIC